MAVKIRLSRIGKKMVPFYRIVAIDSRKKRDGAYLDNLGTYDAHGHTMVQFHEEAFNIRVAQGAIVTDAVKKLLKRHKPMSATETTPVVEKVKKAAPKKEKKAQ